MGEDELKWCNLTHNQLMSLQWYWMLHRCDARMCCRDVFLDWLKMDGGSYSVNWDGMLCLLKDMKLSALARILQEALEHNHH